MGALLLLLQGAPIARCAPRGPAVWLEPGHARRLPRVGPTLPGVTTCATVDALHSCDRPAELLHARAHPSPRCRAGSSRCVQLGRSAASVCPCGPAAHLCAPGSRSPRSLPTKRVWGGPHGSCSRSGARRSRVIATLLALGELAPVSLTLGELAPISLTLLETRPCRLRGSELHRANPSHYFARRIS